MSYYNDRLTVHEMMCDVLEVMLWIFCCLLCVSGLVRCSLMRSVGQMDEDLFFGSSVEHLSASAIKIQRVKKIQHSNLVSLLKLCVLQYKQSHSVSDQIIHVWSSVTHTLYLILNRACALLTFSSHNSLSCYHEMSWQMFVTPPPERSVIDSWRFSSLDVWDGFRGSVDTPSAGEHERVDVL